MSEGFADVVAVEGKLGPYTGARTAFDEVVSSSQELD